MARRFISYPTNQLLAVVDDPLGADAAVASLLANGLDAASIVCLRGEEDVDRLGGLGERGGVFSRLLRTVQFMTMDQMPDFVLYEQAVHDGRTVLAIRLASPAERNRVVEILRRHRAHFMNYYGRFATEEISLWRGPEPAIPGFLRR